MINCKEYSEQELALHVTNDPYFMFEFENRDFLLALVAEEFIYTKAQYDFLIETLNNMAEEV